MVRIRNKIIRAIETIKVKVHLRYGNYSCILLDTPIHGNLGDHAIALAEKVWIKNEMPQEKCMEIPGEIYDKIGIELIKQYIEKKKIKYIFFHGGGNLGTLWMDDENRFRQLLCTIRDIPIIVFPQTVFFEDTKQGKNVLSESKRIYTSNNSLFMTVREGKSYRFVKKEFPNINLFLCPDMALSLERKNKTIQRKGILLCFRTDKESVLNNSIKTEVIEKIKNIFVGQEIHITNTDLGVNRIGTIERKILVNQKLMEFGKSKIVVTDRLHGMIFAAITSTPCIAFDNKSQKVSAAYQWIKDLPYIYLVDHSNYKTFDRELQNCDMEYAYSGAVYYKMIDQVLKKVMQEIGV